MKTLYSKALIVFLAFFCIGFASFGQATLIQPTDGNGIFSKHTSTVASDAAVTLPTSGTGTRLMWIPRKSALRAGTVTGTQWDAGSIGLYSNAQGYNAIASGQSSVAIGTTVTASHANSMAIGNSATTTAANQMMAKFTGGYTFYSGVNASNVAVGVTLVANGNSWASVSDSTKKENFIASDGESVLKSISQMRVGTWNYKGQNARTYRHWGVMAQDFYKHFGKDKIGTIGDDVTIASADFDGVVFAALKALEERTRKMQEEMAIIRKQNDRLEEANDELKEKIEKMEGAILQTKP